MQYKIIDSDSNEFALNGTLTPAISRGTLSRQDDGFEFSQEILEKTFLSGSLLVGSDRLKAKKFTLSAEFAFPSDEGHDAYFNQLIYELRKAVLLEDVTNEKQGNIAIDKLGISYDRGCVKRSGSWTVDVLLLDGYWVGVNPILVNQMLLVGINTIPLNNGGFLPTQLLISISVDDLCPILDVYIDATKEGIQFVDSSLGQATLDTVVIDNSNGTIIIGELDRTQNIVPGSGFFDVPVGNNSLIIEAPVTGSANIEYYERFYI